MRLFLILCFFLIFIVSCSQPNHFGSYSQKADLDPPSQPAKLASTGIIEPSEQTPIPEKEQAVIPIKEDCQELPKEIADRFLFLDNKLSTLEGKVNNNYDIFEMYFEEQQSFLKENKSVFVDCLGSAVFELILDYIQLEKTHIDSHRQAKFLRSQILERGLHIPKQDLYLLYRRHSHSHTDHSLLRKSFDFSVGNLKSLISQWKKLNSEFEEIIWFFEGILGVRAAARTTSPL